MYQILVIIDFTAIWISPLSSWRRQWRRFDLILGVNAKSVGTFEIRYSVIVLRPSGAVSGAASTLSSGRQRENDRDVWNFLIHSSSSRQNKSSFLPHTADVAPLDSSENENRKLNRCFFLTTPTFSDSSCDGQSLIAVGVGQNW